MSYGYRGMAGIGNFKPDAIGMSPPEGVARAAPPPNQPVDNRMGRRQGPNPWIQRLRSRVGAGAPPQYMAGGNQFGLSGFSVPTMEQLGIAPPVVPVQPAAPAQQRPGLAQLQALLARQRGGMAGLGMGGYNPYQRR